MASVLDISSETYAEQKALLDSQSWYHHTLSREGAEARIRRNGEFLVRESTHKHGEFVLTTKWNGRFLHMLITNCTLPLGVNPATLYFTLGEYVKPSIVELVRFHWINQLPMTRHSEAIICRPVLYSGFIPHLSVNSRPLQAATKPGSKGVSKASGRQLSASGPTGSMFNLAMVGSQSEVPRKGTSVTDLRCQSYVEPECFGICPLSSSTLSSSMSPRIERSIHNPLPSSLNDVRFADGTTPSTTTSPTARKVLGISRKQIRYVEMSDAPNTPLTNHSVERSELPSIMVERTSDSVKPNGCTDYDLTRPFPAELAALIGQPERALDDKVWKRLSTFFSHEEQNQHSFKPFNYAGHLALELIRLVTGSWMFSESHLSGSLIRRIENVLLTRTVRQDLLIRDRFLYLFVIATVLFSSSPTQRLGALKFWLEVVQCSNTIFRDRHDLNAVLGALFSPQLRELKSMWDDLSLEHSTNFNSKVMEELHSQYTSTGGTHNSAANTESTMVLGMDFSTQLPNLIPLFLHDRPFSIPFQPEVSCQTIVDDSWIRELESAWREKDPLLAALVRSETILKLLMGPIKLERGPVLDALYNKMDYVLMEMSKVIQST
ncbi:SH2 domain-containing protein 3A [Clonorchis sinensis]|uniref:SH2 domain-containing protein 3A n=2 Tax=Clonorchis sinensis TaxID=79923 RepID=H2KS20_CLOSI|nr:SH2 domain-containing protein 3A [Clonorchis sinensis]GAA31583.2 SH2 domain-containing protein 3A [Clonorchis sinensis]